MTTTETNDGDSTERNVSRRRQTERTSPSAEGTDFEMVTLKENGMISKQSVWNTLKFHNDFNSFYDWTESKLEHWLNTE